MSVQKLIKRLVKRYTGWLARDGLRDAQLREALLEGSPRSLDTAGPSR
jgi:hypothetical protein